MYLQTHWILISFLSHLFNTARYIKPVFRSMASSAALNPSLWSPSSSPITARLRRAAPFALPGGCRRKSFVAASAAFANENREWVLFLLFFKKKKKLFGFGLVGLMMGFAVVMQVCHCWGRKCGRVCGPEFCWAWDGRWSALHCHQGGRAHYIWFFFFLFYLLLVGWSRWKSV